MTTPHGTLARRLKRSVATALGGLFLVVAVAMPAAAQDQPPGGFGLLMDDAAYDAVPRAAPLMRGDFTSLPSSASLKPFAPHAGSQGPTNTCVGWAVGYSARTILQAIDMEWTDREEITRQAFSPSYVYNRLKQPGTDAQCLAGSYLTWGLDLLEREGVAPMGSFPFDCGREVTSDDELVASDYRISGHHRLFRSNANNKITPVKKSLSEGKPVVIGIDVATSFLYAWNREVWSPAFGEAASEGKHAMVVVGYDDEKYGGAFELMNSWGPRWGEDGFIWVRYDDFKEYVYYGFEVFTPPATEADVPLAGRLTLTLSTGEQMAVSRLADRYKTTSAYPSFTTFKAHLTTEAPAYAYVIASDLTRSVTRLVPTDDATSAFLPYSQSNVALLGEDAYMQLDDREGTDYLALLLSTRELDLDAIVPQLHTGAGDFVARLHAALGADLVPADQVTFTTDGALAFTAQAQGGAVVPLVVEIEHTGLPFASDEQPPLVTLFEPVNASSSVQSGAEVTLTQTRQVLQIRGSVIDEGGISALRVDGAEIPVADDGTFQVDVSLEGRPAGPVRIEAEDAAGNVAALALTLRRVVPDVEPPAVVVSEPRVVRGGLRGIVAGTGTRPLRVVGNVEDPSGVESVYVNGTEASIMDDGTFSVEVQIPGQDRRLRIEAVDAKGNRSSELFYALDGEEEAEEVAGRSAFYAEEKDYVTVDVFYATDRQRTGDKDPAAFYGGERGQLEYGRAEVTIPKGHTVGSLESPVWWRLEFSEDPAEHIILQKVTPQAKDQLMKSLRSAVQRSSEREALVFIHGFNNTFEYAARRTAQLAYDIGFDGAPIFYSWPSDGALHRYSADEADVAWTVPHLKSFLEDIARDAGADKVHLIAHSMGNRALTDALVALAREGSAPLFAQVILTAPDIDADLFVRDVAPHLHKTAKRVTLYASSDDKALTLSRKVHGSPRAGESGLKLVVTDGIDTVDATGIDTDLLGHAYFAQTETILQDLHAVLAWELPPPDRKLLRKAKELVDYWLLPRN